MGNLTYWISTVFVSVFLLISSYTYFFSSNTINGLKSLGFPDFFRIQLGVLKFIAAIVIVFPSFPMYMKEWAYSGVGVFLLTAMVAHITHKDSIFILLTLMCLVVALVISRYSL